ncbi:AMP-activated serine/threonine-protein kinase regulatory subunit [Phlyctochytrium planicorne]|nr:AMP-activated serine/threonine-protein kinase regulatory subunit [Phlyctochytrium planicorne]
MGAQHSFFTIESRLELLSRPVGECLLLNQPLVKLDPGETIAEVLRKFKRHNISSAPICTSNLEYVLVDLMDIIAFLSNCYVTIGHSEFIAQASTMMGVTCSQISDFSGCNPTLSVPISSPIEEVVRRMMVSRTHRMVLVEKKEESGGIEGVEELVHLVTQSNLVEFVLLNLDRLHPHPDATLKELGFFGTSPVVCCEETATVIDVFGTMNRVRITALPAQNKAGTITGILTIRDIRMLTVETLPDLLLTVKDFLKKYRPSHILGNVSMTLRDLVRSISINAFHHLFFVRESTGLPTHVITLTDILKYVILGGEESVMGSVEEVAQPPEK